MKNSTQLIIIYFLILSIHLLLIQFGILKGIIFHHLKIDILLFCIFTLGILITLPGIKKGAEQFSLRFLAMTTTQLLLMLALILVLSFNKIQDVKYLGFTAISLFVILLTIQSIFLIKKLNK